MTRLISRHLRGMNTDFHLTVRVEDHPEEAERALDLFDASATWLGAIERTCSRFLPESDLCALNASAGRPFAASADLYAVVAKAVEMAARTDGLFDPTILPALLAAGYTRSFDEIGQREVGVPADAQAAAGWQGGWWREIVLDAAGRMITLPAGVTLDLGGVAKGWAADEVARRFLGAFSAYLIDLGGDLRVRGGPEPGTRWLIGIEDPRGAAPGPAASVSTPEYLAAVELRSGGVATSGPARRWWLRNGQRMHHLIDPRTGQPANWRTGEREALSCTVFAPTAVDADVYAKVAFQRGYPAGLTTLPDGMAGLCVFEDGAFATSPGLEAYLGAQASAQGYAHA